MQRAALLGLGGLGLLLASTYMLWRPEGTPPVVEREPALAVAPAAAPAPAAEPARPPVAAAVRPSAVEAPSRAAPAPTAAPDTTPAPAPRFDVVRVSARGSAVIAGRAAPGSEVLLLLDGRQELGRARADGRGEWVILPSDPLPSGAWELSLRARLAGQETSGPDAVVVVVPEQGPRIAGEPRGAEPRPGGAPADARPRQAAGEPSPAADGAAGPIAVLIPQAPGATPRILQGPQPQANQAGRPNPARLGMDSVEYEERGGIRFAGTAPPGAAVRIYVGERHAGDAVADASGRWALAPEEQPPIGRNALRVDQLAANGTVAARIEVPFQRDALPADAFDSHRVVVQPGTNLWRIARAAYGRGTQFTVIYQANRDQIRDPHRIFPGQVFDLPADEARDLR